MYILITLRIITDNTGAKTEIPSIGTPQGVLKPITDYILARSHDRSLEWGRQVCCSVVLFLNYLNAHSSESDSYVLFRNFSQRLYAGTFDLATGIDPSWLCWRPRSAASAQVIITHLSDFFDWLTAQRPVVTKPNPRYSGDTFDRMCDEVAYQARRDRAFLGHTWGPRVSSHAPRYMVRPLRGPHLDQVNPPAFPENKFEELLNDGFSFNGRPDYRGRLITLLLHGAGFRESEPFHLYIWDVLFDLEHNDRAKIYIHHPEDGMAPNDWTDQSGKRITGNRAAYLYEKYQLKPRNLIIGKKSSGWKGGLHDKKSRKLAHFFPSIYGQWFYVWWIEYLKEVSNFERSHPFAWINLMGPTQGGIYSKSQYIKAHSSACHRIGLKVSKELGTTPHGHRHAYGRRLKKANLEPQIIRRCMHHSSLESQDVYTRPNVSEMIESLEGALHRLDTAVHLPQARPQ